MNKHCDAHSGHVEQLKAIVSVLEEIKTDVKTLVNPKNGIYSRVSKLEFFRTLVVGAITIVFGSGGIYGLVQLILYLK